MHMLLAVTAILCALTVINADLDYTASLYAAAAYCQKEALTEWSCAMCVNQTSGTIMHHHLYHPHTDTTGFIAINHQIKSIIVAFRGSLSLLNWIGNLKTWHHTTPWKGTDANVHTGFLSGYMSVSDEVRHHVNLLAESYDTYDILVTGHSLGGALATLAAVDLYNSIPNLTISLITFGTPRVGDQKWTEYLQGVFDAESGCHRRWVNKADLVPHLPPRALGFRHAPQEHWITLTGDVMVCSDVDGEDGRCSRSLLLANSLVDHLSIFGHLFGPFC